jgi:hypothetical protein
MTVGLSGRCFRALAAAATAAALTGSLSTTSQADPTTFRIGQSSPANTFLAIWMADDAGLYEANGLKLEIVPMAGGRDMANAFATGRIDAMHIGLSSVVRANAANADIRAFGSLSNVVRFALFGKPDASGRPKISRAERSRNQQPRIRKRRHACLDARQAWPDPRRRADQGTRSPAPRCR